jgi:hypothetical protein
MSSSVADVTWLDAFGIPSIFDGRLPPYKEWHDFAFFDRKTKLFALLNFGVHGNPYDARRGRGAALAFLVDPKGKIHTSMKLIPLSELRVSPYAPDFLGRGLAVRYSKKKSSFHIKGKICDVRLELNLPVVSPPVTLSQIAVDILTDSGITAGMKGAAGEVARFWDRWVELPRLEVVGEVGIGENDYPVKTNTGYQDHEGGRFDWGSTAGWDIGVLFCDPADQGEPAKVSFMFYRYGPSGESSYGGIIVRTSSGEERHFESERVRVTTSGEFSGERAFLPGVTRLLYPDYMPKVPVTMTYSASSLSDKVELTFTPKAVCTIVASNITGEGETTFNEMFCGASLRAVINGRAYRKTIPCWFESVRPRGRLTNDHAAET